MQAYRIAAGIATVVAAFGCSQVLGFDDPYVLGHGGNGGGCVDPSECPLPPECVTATCKSGVCGTENVPSGTACATDLVCNGSGQCVGCVTPADCSGQDTECRTRTCSTSGTCGVSYASAGTALAAQDPGDCRERQCNGAGEVISAADDADVPVDGNPCTQDVCHAGMPSNPAMASGAACTEGGGHFCDGSGACVECVSATTCPGQDTDCQSRTCAGNTCGVSFMQAGTPASIQVTGDCKRKQCDGNGGITDAVYDADVPVDFNQCSGDVCTAGQPSNPSLPSGTTCNQNGGQVCNGAGACVECIDSSMCVDQTCVSGACTGVCAPGQVRCKGDVPQSCDSNGNWADGVLCQAYCSQGACINPPSCEGIGAACGPNASTHCCSAMQVPGGSFSRSYDGVTYTDPQYLATVSPFLLDRYEITVGRFHNFVKAYPNNLPSAGDGKNPNNNQQDPGWNDSWNGQLPADQSALKTSLACPGGTWTDSPGGNETKPINCVSWYLAFAFCIWDGGRLPTEAEWNYAAAGGGGAEGQRVYPWSNPPGSTVIDATYAVYQPASIGTVGSKSTKGDARYSQADMAGNVSEWVLDWYAYPYPSTSCNDCANFAATSDRAIRGGNYLSVPDIVKVSVRTSAPPGYTGSSLGWRCARN